MEQKGRSEEGRGFKGLARKSGESSLASCARYRIQGAADGTEARSGDGRNNGQCVGGRRKPDALFLGLSLFFFLRSELELAWVEG